MTFNIIVLERVNDFSQIEKNESPTFSFLVLENEAEVNLEF